MNIKTISLTGSEVRAEFSGLNGWIRNDGTSTVYAGKTAGLTAGADGVVSIPAGGSAPVFDAHGAVYLMGTGSVLLIGSDYSENPFKSSAQSGGSCADEIARAAIDSHAENAAVHLTSEQLSAAVNEVKTYADGKDEETLTAAKTYADGLAMSGGGVAQTYVDEKDAETLAGAQTYADTAVSEHNASANAHAELFSASQSYADSAAQSAVNSANAYTEQYSAKAVHTHTVSEISDFPEIPSAGITEEQLNTAVSAHNTDSSAHAALFAAVKQTPKSFSVSTSSWTTLTTAVAGRTYKATISASGVTTSDYPDVYFNSSSVVAATAADIVADTAANYVVLYAKTKPTATLSGSYFIRKGS